MMRTIVTLAMLMVQPWIASAVSLGKVDVASHLGEPFFSEIPLHLDKGESLSSLFVDLASPIEYRFLEVYRDQIIADLRTAIKQDKRGLRVEISSSQALKTPYINLVLRVRHGRATHFKKFPVFLSLPKVATPRLQQGKPVSVATTSSHAAPTVAKPNHPAAPTTKQASFTPFSGWARTNRYGPMVYGDTIFTVARRLRIDKRYSVHQVAIAIFNKNREKFGKDNINLIKEGSYLDTPTADEVASLSRGEASAAIASQIQQWKKLTQQPRFARVAEAQKNRYAKRVRVGSQAEGVRHTSSAVPDDSEPKVIPLAKQKSGNSSTTQAIAPSATTTPPAEKSQQALSSAAQQRIAQLKSDNDLLQATVTANNKRLAELEKKLAAAAKGDSNPKIKLLEARLMRIQQQLNQERANNKGEMLLWLVYAAAGIIVLLVVVIGVLMRRQPPHPATTQQQSIAETAAETTTKTAEPVSVPVEQQTERQAGEQPAKVLSDSIDSTQDDASAESPAPDSAEAQDEEPSTPDPDVDYLTEADVYLRYGMEEEAEAQVLLALKLRPDDPAAHAKLVEVRQARGNSSEAEAAKSAAMALLTGAGLATFEQLLSPPSSQDENVETSDDNDTPPDTAIDEQGDSEGTIETVPSPITTSEASDDEHGDHDEVDEISALLATETEDTPFQDDDDELQHLLSEVQDDSSDNEEEEDILDLSMDDDGVDSDLESLISSLDIAPSDTTSTEAEENDQQATTDMGKDPEETDISTPLTTMEDDAGTEPAESIEEQPSLPATEEPEITTETAEKHDAEPSSSNDSSIDGELAFDLSDIDLSKAKTEEPLVNSSSVEHDDDLAFDASGLDLSGITLPGSSNSPEEEPAEAAQQEHHSDGIPGLDITLESSSEPSVTKADTTAESKTETATPTTPSGLDISLDMDDLDALLAHDESTPTTEAAKEQPEKPTQNQSIDEELGSLLDGLDDLDLDEGKP